MQDAAAIIEGDVTMVDRFEGAQEILNLEDKFWVSQSDTCTNKCGYRSRNDERSIHIDLGKRAGGFVVQWIQYRC
jgi:hypothetical protein